MSFPPTFPAPPRPLTPKEALPRTQAILQKAKREWDAAGGKPRSLTAEECAEIAAEFSQLRNDQRQVAADDAQYVKAVQDYWAEIEAWNDDQIQLAKLNAKKKALKKTADMNEKEKEAAAELERNRTARKRSKTKRRQDLGLGGLGLGMLLLKALMSSNLRFVIIVVPKL